MAKTEIFTLGLDGKQYLSVATKLKKEIDNLSRKQKELKKNGRESSAVFVQNSVDLKDLKSSYGQAQKGMSDYNKQQIKTSTLEKEINSEFKKEVNTINEANQQITRLNKTKKSLNVNNKEEKALLDQINKKIDENTDFVKKNSSSIENQKINIGNYSSALDGVSPRLKGWITQGRTLVSGLKAQKLALKGTTSGLKLFRIALISTGIGAIVVVLGLLIAAFSKSQRGVDALSRALTPLKILFQSVIGVVEQISFKMVEAFKNPKKFIGSLINVFKPFAKILQGIVTLDFNAVKEGFNDIKDKIVAGTKAASEFTKEALSRGSKIANLNIEISKQESEIARKREKNLNLIREQELITKDKTKSQKQINEALKKAEQLTKDNLSNENKIINLKIQKLKLEQKSNDTSREELKGLNELEAQIEINKGKARGIEIRFLGVKNRISSENHAKNIARSKELVAIEKQKLDEATKNMAIEIEMFKLNNEVKLKEDENLNAAFLKNKLAYLGLVNVQEKAALDFKLKNGLIKENEYNLAKLQLEKDFQNQKQEVLKAVSDKEEQDKAMKIEANKEARQIEFELRLEEIAVNKETEYLQKLEIEEAQYENDQAILQDKLTAELITKAQHDRSLEVLKKNHLKKTTKLVSDQAKAENRIEEIKTKAKLNALSSTFNAVAELVGKETALGKAAAIAGATIDTYQSAVSAYKGMVSAIPGPVGIIAGAVAAAGSIATGISTVKKIVAVKEPSVPKAEKGALFKLEGKRHSQGGEDIVIGGKTMGNMEGGEVLGVMSREASDKFMAFNNLYTGGNSQGGYLENGGVISTSAYNNVTDTTDINSFAEAVSNSVNNIKVVVPVLDIQEVANEHNTIVANATI